MNKQELTNTVQKIIDDAKKIHGVTDVAVGGTLGEGLEVTVRLGETEKVEFDRAKSIEILVYKGKSKGAVEITDLTPGAIDSAINAAARIADYTEPDEYAGLADKELLATNFPNLDLEHPAAVEPERAMEYAKECEDAAFAYDKRISNSDGASFSTKEGFYIYGNSNGFLGSYSATRYSAVCIVIGELSGLMQRDYDYTVARDVHDLHKMKNVGVTAAERTIARLGASKIKTCSAPVLFVPRIANRLWGAFVSAISGGNLYQERSFLLDSLDTQIFPNFMQIKERPHLPKYMGSAPFDAEGVATYEKSVIKDGVLNTYLFGSYSARRMGMKSTGNAGGVHNLCIEGGTEDYKQLIKKMDRGLIVTEVMGQGINIVTGDYSQGASGFWVENGEIVNPVEEITVAGNLKDMFANVIAVGTDVDKRGSILSGSLLLDDMMIAGD